MATLTKNVKRPIREYQQWAATDITVGDILGVVESLGKSARVIQVESLGGDSVIRFNVSRRVFKSQEAVGNTYIADAAFWKSPQLTNEIEEETPDIAISAGTTQTWTDEIAVADIKVVSKAPSLRITVS